MTQKNIFDKIISNATDVLNYVKGEARNEHFHELEAVKFTAEDVEISDMSLAVLEDLELIKKVGVKFIPVDERCHKMKWAEEKTVLIDSQGYFKTDLEDLEDGKQYSAVKAHGVTVKVYTIAPRSLYIK